MEKYSKNICTTCRYLYSCVLTEEKSSVISCSEYDHTIVQRDAMVVHSV